MALTYFTLAELRAMKDMGDTTRYSDARCTAAGEYVEALIERVVTTSFVERTVTEVHNGSDAAGRDWLALHKRHPRSVSALTQNGVAFTGGELAELYLEDRFLRRRATGSYTSFQAWEHGVGNISVTYLAGYSSTPPYDVREAALQATRHRLIMVDSKSGVSDRATSITNEFGNVNLSTASVDHPTGLPEADAVIVGWREKFTKTPGII